MIISLYDSNYPIVKNEEPKWDDLPLGYFDFNGRKLKGVENNEIVNLYGDFIFSGTQGTFRPRSGEHLLAVFSYKGIRYIYNATISYTLTSLGRKQTWWARLGISYQIRKW